MKLELLEVGAKTELLAACTRALLLGVFTEDNYVDQFLKDIRDLFEFDHAILVFYNEPYLWYSNKNKAICSPYLVHQNVNLSRYFNGKHCIDTSHPNYALFSEYINTLGVKHTALTAFQLHDNQQFIGYALVFDDESKKIEAIMTKMAQLCVNHFIQIIQLRLANEELKDLYEQQVALNLSKTRFFQVIAHDLRAPFQGLLGFSDVLVNERHTLDEQGVQDVASYLSDTAQATYNLLESLLSWAVADGGHFAYHPISFDLKQLGSVVVDVLQGYAKKKNIRFVNSIESHVQVYADMNMMTSVMQNLVSNALKFSPTDGSGEVIIRSESYENNICFFVQDNGLGMSKTKLERLFNPKFRVTTKGTVGESGAGLGLVLCKRFIEMNQGRISVSSQEGKGTTFKVSLPKNKESIGAYNSLQELDFIF